MAMTFKALERKPATILPPVGSLVRDAWGGCFGIPRTYRVKEHITDASGFPALVCTAPDGGPVGWHGLEPIASVQLLPAMVRQTGA